MWQRPSLYILPFILIFLSGMIMTGCGGSGENNPMRVKPPSMGKIFQINTLVSPETYNSSALDTFDFRFGRAYPILPQPEPYFDLRYYEINELDQQPLLRRLKCFLVLADMSLDDELADMVRKDFRESVDFSESGVKIGRNKWAQDQIIVYIFAPDQASLIKEINRSYLTISERIEDSYEYMIKSTVFVQGENTAIQDSIREKFGVDMKIPADFVSALETDSLLWLRQEITDISRSIMISRFPYTDPAQFEESGMIRMRDRMGRYVSSTIEGTYMKVNNVDLPTFVFQTDELEGLYAVKAEGIWEIEGDFLGGPFVSYAILDENRQEVIYVDGFVYSPEKKKKISMVYLDYILRQTRIGI